MTESVLIVDDEPSELFTLETVLQPLGQDLVTASSGTEALRQVLERDFAVILLDVQMADLNGFETARLIRERPRSSSTPIIFLTAGYRSDEDIFRGYAVGAVDYVLKPLVPEFLRSKVAVFVEQP
jgi:CheY-like chemotaxis protein